MSGDQGAALPAGRVGWIDATRGVGILLVVAGHVVTATAVRNAIFLFHMPLFFFLSGHRFQPRPIGALLRHRGQRSLKPYLMFLMLVTAVDVVASLLRPGWHAFVVDDPARALVSFAWGGQRLYGVYGVFWFVPCLLATQVVATLLARLRGGLRGNAAWLTPAMIVVGYLTIAIHRDWPLDLGVVPMALVFFIAGHLFPGDEPGRGRLAVALLLAIAGLMLPGTIDMKYGHYGVPLWNLAVAAAWCDLLCRGCRRLVELAPRLATPLRYCGEAALSIMFLHLAVSRPLLGVLPEPAILALAVALPIAFDAAIRRWPAGRRLFLGR